MKNYKALMLIALSFISFGCSHSSIIQLEIANPSEELGRAEVVSVPVGKYKLSMDQAYMVIDGEQELAFELIDQNEDQIADQLLVDVVLDPKANKVIELAKGKGSLTVTKRTQAEISIKSGGTWDDREYIGGAFQNVSALRVPEQHTDHSYFIRYEGPGWESEYAAYRFYLDWRNGIDFFGKRTRDMVLQQVGQDGFDSYHEYSDWGMDLLKVGKTLGLGSIGRIDGDSLYRFQQVDSVSVEISANGKLYSEITTQYKGWTSGVSNTSLTSTLGIYAGSPLTSHKLAFSKPIEGFCTGLVANPGEDYIDKKVGDYRVLASFGEFSLNKDNIGLAIIVRNDQVSEVFDSSSSHVVTFRPAKDITYYFMAVWEQDPNEIGAMSGFEALLDQELTKLNAPVVVK